MLIETLNEKVKASQFVGQENIIEMVEGDIIVPDIKPDILNIIDVSGTVYVTKKELLENKMKVEGAIDICALYIADNENNSIRSINAMLNFNETIDMLGIKEGMIPIIKYELGTIEHKIINGRKINVKCPIEFNISVIENKEIELVKEIAGDESIQVLKEEIKFNSLVASDSERVEVKENISLPENSSPISEILKYSVEVVNKDYKISYNKILAKADIKFKILYVAEDESETIQTFETIIPITGFIDVQGVNDTMNVDVDYNILSLYTRLIYQDVKANGIYVESDIEISARAYEEKAVSLIQDVYNPKLKIEYDASELEVNQNKIVKNPNEFILNQTLSIPELDDAKVLDVNVIPEVTEVKNLDDKIIIDSNLKLNILYYKPSKRTIETKIIDIPFQQVVTMKNENRITNKDIKFKLVEVSYSLHPSGQLQIKVIVNTSIDMKDTIKFNMISNIKQTEEKCEPKASVIIYYVKEGDSLWKIAKRFGTTVELIMQANGLTSDKIYPMQQILIPRMIYRVVLDPLS